MVYRIASFGAKRIRALSTIHWVPNLIKADVLKIFLLPLRRSFVKIAGKSAVIMGSVFGLLIFCIVWIELPLHHEFLDSCAGQASLVIRQAHNIF